jgi:arylsulfatase A-like enzyme
MLADDMGYNDVSYRSSIIQTPNIDEISKSPHTIRLDNFHSGSPVCSPSRVSLIIEQYPDKNCVNGVNTRNQFPARNIMMML